MRETLEAQNFDGHVSIVEELSEEFDPAEIAAAALQMLWTNQHSSSAEMMEEVAADGERAEAGMTRLFVGLGRQDGLHPGALVGAIVGESGIPAKSIGAIANCIAVA